MSMMQKTLDTDTILASARACEGITPENAYMDPQFVKRIDDVLSKPHRMRIGKENKRGKAKYERQNFDVGLVSGNIRTFRSGVLPFSYTFDGSNYTDTFGNVEPTCVFIMPIHARSGDLADLGGRTAHGEFSKSLAYREALEESRYILCGSITKQNLSYHNCITDKSKNTLFMQIVDPMILPYMNLMFRAVRSKFDEEREMDGFQQIRVVDFYKIIYGLMDDPSMINQPRIWNTLTSIVRGYAEVLPLYGFKKLCPVQYAEVESIVYAAKKERTDYSYFMQNGAQYRRAKMVMQCIFRRSSY